MTIGTELRQAREQRGLSLVEVSARTKIRMPILRAIERDDFRQLPGGVISRGFLRLFAREVGLDANEIGARFTAEFESADPGHAAGAVAEGTGSRESEVNRGLRMARAAGLAAAGIVILAVGYMALRPSPNSSGTTANASSTNAGVTPAGSPSASSAAEPSSAPAAPSAPPPSASVAKAEDVLRVDLQATAACWISVSADGEQIAYRELKAGERLAVRATKEAVLRIGIPANLTVSINDQPMPPPARPGTPVTLRITPANYKELLKP